jgi:V8-like Glu-specific endopeptidase
MTGLKTLLLSAAAVAIPHMAAAEVPLTCWIPAQEGLSASILAYWTPERMVKARPDDSILDAPEFFGAERKKLKEGEPDRAPIKEAPYKFGGMLFYTRNDIDYGASAQFVADDNIVIGAAHSIWKNGKMAKNIVFTQGYSAGGGEAYEVDLAAVLQHWTVISENPVSPEKSQFDYSVMRTKEPSKVGKYALVVSGAKPGEEVTATGYPDTKEEGEYMYRETEKVYARDGDTNEVRPFLMSGDGASGGAWFLKQDQSKAVGVLSVSSMERAYGPSFTDDTVEMVQKVKTGC